MPGVVAMTDGSDLLTAAVGERIEKRIVPEQFLLNNFFGQTRFFSGRWLEVDTKYQKRVLSPVVSRYHPGVVLKRPAVSAQAYDVPKLAPYRIITLAELDQRGVGQDSYSSAGQAGVRSDDIVVDDLVDLENTILLRTELFASSLLTLGKIRYLLDGETYEEFSYGANLPPTYTPPKDWATDPAANPINDLKIVRSQIIARTGVAPDMVVFSDKSADIFLSSKVVQEQLNKLHLIIGQIQPARPTGTAQYMGRLLYPALEMWTYSAEYIPEDNPDVTYPMVPAHAAIVGTSKPSGYAYYGSILEMSAEGTYQEVEDSMLVPRVLRDIKNETAEIRLQSRPCLVPYDFGGFCVINVSTPPSLFRKSGRNGVPDIHAESSQGKKGEKRS